MKKLVLAGLLVWGFAAVLNAAPIVRIDFPCQNFWGQLTCVDQLPDGVWLGERTGFWDKKKKGYDFPMFVDLAKITEFELTFKFEGQGMARMSPALTGYADDDRTEQTDLQVVFFDVDGDKSFRAPATFKNWYSLTPFISATDKELKKGSPVKAGQKYYQIFVTNGKTIKVHAKFKKQVQRFKGSKVQGAREYRERAVAKSSEPSLHGTEYCTMCGPDFCSVRLSAKLKKAAAEGEKQE